MLVSLMRDLTVLLNLVRLLYSTFASHFVPYCTQRNDLYPTDIWSEIGNDLHSCCKYFTMIYFHGKSRLLRLFLVTIVAYGKSGFAIHF